jgi:hypothetical protein
VSLVGPGSRAGILGAACSNCCRHCDRMRPDGSCRELTQTEVTVQPVAVREVFCFQMHRGKGVVR